MSVKQFVEINSVRTSILSWPSAIKNDKIDEVIICIPGNPGVARFYIPFLEAIHRITKIPVWIVAHAGHDLFDTDGDETLSFEKRQDVLNLQGQLRSKLEFIVKYTHSTTKIHLIGHSIGGWMVVEMLKNNAIKSRIVTANLLCPTIERMAITPNGKHLNMIRPISFMVKPLIWTFCNFPNFLKSWIVRAGLRFYDIAPTPMIMDTCVRYLRISFVENIMYMGYDELDIVKDLDIDTLVGNSEKINILYGYNDLWAPKDWFSSLKKRIPSMYIREVPFEHCFVLYPTDELAKMTAELIMKK